MQREAAAGDDIRQTAVLLQKLIKIQIVVAYDELDVHIRQLGLNIGGIGLVQAGAPQIHLNGLGIFLLLHLFCVFCATAGQQEKPHRQCCQHGYQAAQCSFVHQIVLLTTLGQPPFCGKAAVAYGPTSLPAGVCAVKPAHGNACVPFCDPEYHKRYLKRRRYSRTET